MAGISGRTAELREEGVGSGRGLIGSDGGSFARDTHTPQAAATTSRHRRGAVVFRPVLARQQPCDVSPTTQTWGAGVPRPRRRSWHRSAVSPDPSGRKRAHLVSPVHPGREEPPYFWAPRRLRHTRNHPARHRDRPGGSVSARMRSIRAWSRRVTCACCRSCSFQDATTNCSTMCDGSSLARRLRHELAPVRRRLSFAASSATASPPHVPLPSPVVDRHQADGTAGIEPTRQVRRWPVAGWQQVVGLDGLESTAADCDSAKTGLSARLLTPMPTSALTLTGFAQHMAEVEGNWLRRVLAGEPAPPIYDPNADPSSPDGGFELAEKRYLEGRPRHLARGDCSRPRAPREAGSDRHWALHGAGRQPPLDLCPPDRGIRPPQRSRRPDPGVH